LKILDWRAERLGVGWQVAVAEGIGELRLAVAEGRFLANPIKRGHERYASVQFPDMRDPSIELRATLRVGLQWRSVATGVAPCLNRLCVRGGRPQFCRGAHGGETAWGAGLEEGSG
jgi:hypothetical protein